MNSRPILGILGAGKLGITLAQIGLKSGYQINIASSKNPKKIAMTVNILAPGAKAMTTAEVAKKSDVIILALPLKNLQQIPQAELANKIVIDAMNYWWETDGPREKIIPRDTSSSEYVQEILRKSTVIKTFSHMGYHHLYDENHKNPRKSLAIAGDNKSANEVASKIVADFGFDPLFIGNLKSGKILEPGQPGFGVNLEKSDLQKLLKV